MNKKPTELEIYSRLFHKYFDSEFVPEVIKQSHGKCFMEPQSGSLGWLLKNDEELWATPMWNCGDEECFNSIPAMVGNAGGSVGRLYKKIPFPFTDWTMNAE